MWGGGEGTFGPVDVEAAGPLFECPDVASADARTGRDANAAGYEDDELTRTQPNVQPGAPRWKRDLTQVDFEPAGAELVAVTHFAQGLRTIGAFAHTAVQVDVCGGDHRHRQGERDGRQHQPASPARERGEDQCRADRDHRPGGELPVDTRKPRACHREQDRPRDDGGREHEPAEQPPVGARVPLLPGGPRHSRKIGARLAPSSGTSSRIARYSAIPTPEKIASPTNAMRNRIGSTSK